MTFSVIDFESQPLPEGSGWPATELASVMLMEVTTLNLCANSLHKILDFTISLHLNRYLLVCDVMSAYIMGKTMGNSHNVMCNCVMVYSCMSSLNWLAATYVAR